MSIDVAVVGGGPAGMLASAIAADRGLRVVLFEKNSYTGKKLGITGKGRCNLTNRCGVQEVLQHVPSNPRFLYSALSSFSPEDVMRFFEKQGVPLKTERGNRVFPVSDRAADVVQALRRNMKRAGVQVRHETVTDIEAGEGRVTAVVTEKERVPCRAVIVCTGGASYPLTGSTGDGYRFAGKLGHTVVPPRPSLVPLETEQAFCRDLQGLSLRNVTLRAYDSRNTLLYEELGEMLFTHYGVSGPLVLSASAHMRDFDRSHYYLTVDLKPGLDEKKLDARLLRDFEKYHGRTFANSLGDLLHKRMIPVLVRLSGIDPETKISAVTREQRRRLASLLKCLRIDVAGPRPMAEAIVTAGGVSVREVDPKTMASKRVDGLYFAGEILDVDAYTGGFNLQIAWSTAAAAGRAVLQ